MYYFELFEIPISLKVNKSEILKKYYQLSKKYHPDNFTLENEESQVLAEKMSAQINEAKKILDDAYLRLAYILKEKNIIDADEKYTLSPMFLGEMMDINEALMDIEMNEPKSEYNQIKNKISTIENDIYQPIKKYFDMDILNVSQEEFLQLKDFYFKQKYLNRIKEKL